MQLTADPLLAAARELEPDVLLFESRCYTAPAVARAVGAYPVLQAVRTLLPPEVEELVSDAVTPFWHELDLGRPQYAGIYDGLTLSAFPSSLDDPSGSYAHRARAVGDEMAQGLTPQEAICLVERTLAARPHP